MPATHNSEREPLLSQGSAPADSDTPSRTSKYTSVSIPGSTPPITTARPGPLEIDPSTRYGILCGIWLANFLSALNSTMVATLVTSISSEFQRSHQASWLGTSYLLATSTFTPLYGRLSNVLGRRGANQVAILFAGLGTIACGLSQNMDMLILGRFLCGIGGGGIFTTASIITSDMYSMRERSLTQGYANIFNGLGMGLGGPFGGYISDRFGWRWAFLVQAPFFVAAFSFTTRNLTYTTPGKSKGTLAVLKRIDYGGSFFLLSFVLSLLFFLSFKYNSDHAWNSPLVYGSLISAGLGFVFFVSTELWFAPEPVLAPFLLRQKVPVLVGINNFLVAVCNFSIIYFFPMWFETVELASSSIAGMHILPNSLAMSFGSLFAGWYLHKTGKYKMLNVVFGILPTMAAALIFRLREDSGVVTKWISIIPLGFGNSVVLQTTLIALLASINPSDMAVGTGFVQLFRGIGQVSGVAVSSAIFQSLLGRELRLRITGPDAESLIASIRHSARFVATLPPDLQRAARDSYNVALKAVFLCAMCCTFAAFLIRLPIPELSLDSPDSSLTTPGTTPTVASPTPTRPESPAARTSLPYALPPPSKPQHGVSWSDGPAAREATSYFEAHASLPKPRDRPSRRRLSTYESADGLDLEADDVGGSARP